MLLTVLLDVGGSSFWPGVLPEIYVVFFAGGCFAKWTVARVEIFEFYTAYFLIVVVQYCSYPEDISNE